MLGPILGGTMPLRPNKPFARFFEMSEEELKAVQQPFSPKETALIETYFHMWCKSNGMDISKAPAYARMLYLSGFVTGVSYSGHELHGKNLERPFH